GGPGERREGGGFIGSGFGVEGAAEGMLIASALNMLTSSRRIDTVICLQTSSAELFLHSSHEAPDSMRIRLSPVFNILRQRQAAPFPAAAAGGSTADELERIVRLHEQGALTDEEFVAVKRKHLGQPRTVASFSLRGIRFVAPTTPSRECCK